ncbi:MAG: hypothetical protein AB1Y22_05700 [Cycloclasticus sp.]
MNKSELKGKIEPFIFNKLSNQSYEIKTRSSSSLLTWNRFDIAFKLFYLDNKENNIGLARLVYEHDIRAQTLGSFEEYGNDDKQSFEAYVCDFKRLYEDIFHNGFDKEKTIVPLSDKGTIINGSHRVSAAIHLMQTVSCVQTDRPIMTCDYDYFFNRNVPTEILDIVARKFIEYAEDVYIAFLWPSGRSNLSEVVSKFSRVIYKKNISLKCKGGFNLIVELYKHMEWLGNVEVGFSGAKQKLTECFTDFDDVTVIAFQADSIERVREIKKEIRDINKIGFSSVHITDTKEESIRISKLVFSENGLHFLNFSEPYKYQICEDLKRLRFFLNESDISPDDVLIDGSSVLSLYGIRRSEDLDYLTVCDSLINSHEFDKHDSELVYHNRLKEDLIYNPKYYFEYFGFKFVSFEQLYYMKEKRCEEKDSLDCLLMKKLIEDKFFSKNIGIIKQSIFYFRIRSKERLVKWVRSILKYLRLYDIVRLVYRKLRGRS